MRLPLCSVLRGLGGAVCAALIGLAALPAGAADAPKTPPAGMAAEAPAAAGYRVSRGDELNFRFVYAPELNTTASVRSDGRVALPFAGELVAEGLSMDELKALVEQRLSSQVRRPQVFINVQGGTTQRVFVGGEVGRPGMQPLIGPLTALQAVMVAEGLKDAAQPRDVLVLRRGPSGERLVLPVDLAAAMAGTEGAQDITLQAYDVVIVPRSGIASLNLWVDQYIRRVLPISLGFSYTLNRNGVVQ
jgi:protein involved in polysaccharide export with SLBB domain